MLVDGVEGAGPAGLVKEVEGGVEGGGDALGGGGFVDVVFGGHEGPVDEEGAADEVALRDQAPVAAVEAVGAVVTHDEVVARRDNEVIALYMGRKVDGPGGGGAGEVVWRAGGEVIVVRAVVGVGGEDREGLSLRDAVAEEDTVAEVDTVAGKADDALDEDVVVAGGVGRGAEEDNGFIVLERAVGDDARPGGGGGERGAVDEDVVADEQGAGHGGRGDDEVLDAEGDEKEPDGDHAGEGGEGEEAGFFRLRLRGVVGRGHGVWLRGELVRRRR